MTRGGRIDPLRFPDGTLDPDARVDVAIAESFPASDPPSWNGGLETRPEWKLTEIVAASDLSDCSRNALDHAVALALSAEAALTVVHAHDPGPRYRELYRSTPPEPGSPPSYATLHADALGPIAPPVDDDAMAALVETHRSQLESLPQARRVAVAGPPVEAVLDAAQTVGAGLIVVGSQGRGAVAGVLLGSTADALIRRSRVPVLAVPCRIARRTDGAVVAVLDDPDVADDILRHATAVAGFLRAELVTLRVPNDGRVDQNPLIAPARLVVIAYPRDEARRIGKSDPNVRVLLRSGLAPVLTVPVD